MFWPFLQEVGGGGVHFCGFLFASLEDKALPELDVCF